MELQVMTREMFMECMLQEFPGLANIPGEEYIGNEFESYMKDKEEYGRGLNEGSWGRIIESLRREEARISLENKILLLQEALDV